MKPVSISVAKFVFRALYGRCKYGLGSKADYSTFLVNVALALRNLAKILKIDCSGFVRLAIFIATNGAVRIPDGSINQNDYFEKLARDPDSGVRRVKYADAARYMTRNRLFIAFIRAGHNGCGRTGHVWLLVDSEGKPETLESHSGRGVNSRDWDYGVLPHQVYACYELPAIK